MPTFSEYLFDEEVTGLKLPNRKANEKAKKERDNLANTKVPENIIPKEVFIAMPEHIANKAVSTGIIPGKKGLLGHSENRLDSIYVATTIDRVKCYFGKVIIVDTSKLDKNKFYYDPLDWTGRGNDHKLKHPQQLAYRGVIPHNAISHVVMESTVLDKNDIKDIILNALGLNPSNEDDYLGNNLADYNNRKEILHAQAIRNLPNYDEIQRIITVEYNKFTIGTLIDFITQLVNPSEE